MIKLDGRAGEQNSQLGMHHSMEWHERAIAHKHAGVKSEPTRMSGHTIPAYDAKHKFRVRWRCRHTGLCGLRGQGRHKRARVLRIRVRQQHGQQRHNHHRTGVRA